MQVSLAYGKGLLPLEFPDDRTTVIQPSFTEGLEDEKGAFLAALDEPIGSEPLFSMLRPEMKVCIPFTDITRATPNERIIPWILQKLGDHPRENILLFNQLGTHRPNTREELEQMLTPEVVANYRVLNHDCRDDSVLVEVGKMDNGVPARIHREVVEADLRIVTGFIEPHFFAGFSGGPKGLIPGCAALDTVMASHRAENIGHPQATFGVTYGNPLWEELLRIARGLEPTFLVNVSLNESRDITGIFAGDLEQAHQQGYEFVRRTAMQEVPEPFDVVVTTNSGYPLDQNLYQGVKGMSAAARIVKEGGVIILACECSDGVPDGSPYENMVHEYDSPEAILAALLQEGKSYPEQWQAQIQALCQSRAEVYIYSALPQKTIEAMHLEPIADIAATVRQALAERGPDSRVAVLPQGPLTIPYQSIGEPQQA